ncbi:hypothetical protein AB1Y20_017511 [Prymnesium parvum]|uniref:Uncharacterized protein n=1 Tax=Prymnesium parvum TaxID=97485 RepID=A0AB34JKQ9_PRYPA
MHSSSAAYRLHVDASPLEGERWPEDVLSAPATRARPAVAALLSLAACVSMWGFVSVSRRPIASDPHSVVELHAQGNSTLPVQSAWPGGVANVWLDPSQAQVDELYDRMRQESGEYSGARAAILLTRDHTVSRLGVGFFTSVAGVEAGVAVESLEAVDEDGEFLFGPQTSTHGFWRSVEGLDVQGRATWSMSQAAPIRRCRFRGDLRLRADGQYVSGGFISNSIVHGVLHFDGQQQYLARNCQLHQGYTESSLNIVLVGCEGSLGVASEAVSQVQSAPRVAEKPFLEWTGRGSGEDPSSALEHWSIVVPAFGSDVQGVQDAALGARRIPFASAGRRSVLVVEPHHAEAEIHAALSHRHCEALIFAPGIYTLTSPLKITRPGVVLLGLGVATLTCASVHGCVHVGDGLADVRIAGLLLDAGVEDLLAATAPLLRWGSTPAASPGGLLSDVHARLTAMPHQPTGALPAAGCTPKRADVMVQLESSGVTLDHSWLWHADHDQCAAADASRCSLPYRGTCVSDDAVSSHGLVVHGDDVTAYGLQIEHHKATLSVWNGRGGRVFMFQAELPYTDPAFSRDQFGYFVARDAVPHAAVGVGVYSIFGGCRQQVAIRMPRGATLDRALIMQIDGRSDAFRALVCSSDEPVECACTALGTPCPPLPSVSPLRMRRLPWSHNGTAHASDPPSLTSTLIPASHPAITASPSATVASSPSATVSAAHCITTIASSHSTDFHSTTGAAPHSTITTIAHYTVIAVRPSITIIATSHSAIIATSQPATTAVPAALS